MQPQFDSSRAISSDNDIVLSGCRLDQTSADAYISGNYCGAFSYYLMQAIRGVVSAQDGDDQYFRISYRELVDKVGSLLRKNGYDQVPCYEGPESCHDLDLFRLPKVTRDPSEIEEAAAPIVQPPVV